MSMLAQRRRRMDMVSEQGYIQDGMIFQLDAINKGSNEGYWTDLIGGVKYALQQTTETGIDYIKVPPVIDSDVNFNNPSTFKTAEFCFSELTKGGAFFYGGTATKSLSFVVDETPGIIIVLRYGRSRGGTQFVFDSDTCVNLSTRNAGTISGNNNLMMFRGNISTTTGIADFADRNNIKTEIGGRPQLTGNYSRTACKVHALRFYNRLLTQDEMLHNQRIDNERFNLGLTI